jgi:hypothetical protein
MVENFAESDDFHVTEAAIVLPLVLPKPENAACRISHSSAQLNFREFIFK